VGGRAREFSPGLRSVEQAIQGAVDAMEEHAFKPLAGDKAQSFARARAMAALLTRCYANQVYGSAAAAALAARDPDFPWPWWESLPDAGALRHFREENKSAIHRGLVAALRCQVEQKICAGMLTRINGPQLAEEASRRIVMAAFADSTELEGN
jgi:hypothetical protein